LIEADITAAKNVLVDERYDLITAFRFVLNAQPNLRIAGLEALAGLLRGPQARLVITIQASVPSYRSVQRWADRGEHRNFMTKAATDQLLARTGLRCIEEVSYDFFSGRAFKLLGARRLSRVENGMRAVPGLTKLGGHRLLVLEDCRR
jgi:hypothetical protein